MSSHRAPKVYREVAHDIQAAAPEAPTPTALPHPLLALQRQVGNRATAQRVRRPDGLPPALQLGLEQLSGMDLSGVRVHSGSPHPARVGAAAFTQGSEIHVAPGQDGHLPHEGWHAVQQLQGRVRPTSEVGGMPLNDDRSLEHEADVMGARALSLGRRAKDI